ncbi:restriction endonuclease subunit S [Halomonas sp. 11-S5]|uniref:restriction endonuclease subunit S n=1 Tax=Halomonas sp. 11-S5 TaxID=2994064 RepID=UPI002468975D|nr:restriction endonuclease subunit S [Halomonas sp. 11-S5]
MKTEKQALVPRLRFPEFRDAGEWDFRELDDACEVNPSNSTLPKSFVYIDLESVEAGQLIKKKNISREGAPSRAQRILKNGDVIFQIVRPYQKNNLFFEFDNDENYVASTGYAQLRAFGSEGFLYQVIHTDDFVARVLSKCTGSNYPAINSSDLAKVHLAIPVPDEQQKIADFLSSLDALIAAQADKIDALKTHKKGLMQQLFPREGETVPRLRFPGFLEAGEWVDQELENMAIRGSGHTPNKKYPSYYNGGIKWVSLADSDKLDKGYLYKTKNEISKEGLQNSSAVLHPAETVVLSRDAGVGKSAVLHTPMAVSQHFIAWRCDNAKLNNWFFYYLLQRLKPELESIAVGNTIKTIGLFYFKSMVIAAPSVSEQKNIADCLSSLDSLIAAQADKLEALKAHKKGLMQQLFPSPEDLS